MLNRDAGTPLSEELWMLLRTVCILAVGMVGGALGAALYRELSHLGDIEESGDPGMIPIEDDDGSW